MDGDSSSSLIILLIGIGLILLSAFFRAAKAAVVAFHDAKLKKLADEGDKKALRLSELLQSPSRFIASCDILGMLFAVGAEAVAVWGITRLALLQQLADTPWMILLLVALILVLTVIIYLFGYALPKRLAERNPEGFAFFCVAPFRFFRALFAPLIWLLIALGGNAKQESEDATEEEIRMMVDVGNEKGIIEESQKDMINNVFEFDDRTAEEVMTHRTDIIAVGQNTTISDVVYYAINEGFSRIPVYEDDIDNIVGIIYVKDLLCLIGCQSTADFQIADFIRPILYVPESNRCRDLFKEFTDKKIHMAVVVDEYGGTAGIVTMEDLLESIVGSIQDEYDDEEIEIEKLNDTTYLIDGGADLEEVAETLGLELGENEDYDTLGGLITDILGRIPDDGETPTMEYQGIRFTATVVEDRRIVKAKAEILPPPATEE